MAGLTESWVSDKAKDGVRVAGQGEEFAVGVLPETESDYIILYDTLDGQPLRVPKADRDYYLAKARAMKPGERADWVKVPATGGVTMWAAGGVEPSFSETPVVLQANKTKPLAMAQGVKAVRSKRKRGKRGKRKVLS